jgi:dihydropteroate synthase
VIPVVRALSVLGVPISVDTMKTEVMAESLAAGASIINDINALQSPGALDVVAATDAGVCLMHMQGEPRTMQQAPAYDDVASDVKRFLLRQADAAMARGVARERISLDPGFGFGKSLEHNLALFRSMDTWVAEGFPLLVGVSRKTMIGAMTGRPVGERVTGSAVAAVLAAQRGAQILRVHDVAATRDALSIWAAIDLGRTNAY